MSGLISFILSNSYQCRQRFCKKKNGLGGPHELWSGWSGSTSRLSSQQQQLAPVCVCTHRVCTERGSHNPRFRG